MSSVSRVSKRTIKIGAYLVLLVVAFILAPVLSSKKGSTATYVTAIGGIAHADGVACDGCGDSGGDSGGGCDAPACGGCAGTACGATGDGTAGCADDGCGSADGSACGSGEGAGDGSSTGGF